jgi:hypothetical protein
VDACACTSACACARACVRAGVTERSPAQPGPATAPGHPLPNLFRSCAQHQRTHGGQRHTTSFACKAVARRTWRRPPPRADPSPCRRPCASQPLSVKVGLCLDSLFSPLCLSVCLSVSLSLSLSLSLCVSLPPCSTVRGFSPQPSVWGSSWGAPLKWEGQGKGPPSAPPSLVRYASTQSAWRPARSTAHEQNEHSSTSTPASCVFAQSGS